MTTVDTFSYLCKDPRYGYIDGDVWEFDTETNAPLKQLDISQAYALNDAYANAENVVNQTSTFFTTQWPFSMTWMDQISRSSDATWELSDSYAIGTACYGKQIVPLPVFLSLSEDFNDPLVREQDQINSDNLLLVMSGRACYPSLENGRVQKDEDFWSRIFGINPLSPKTLFWHDKDVLDKTVWRILGDADNDPRFKYVPNQFLYAVDIANPKGLATEGITIAADIQIKPGALPVATLALADDIEAPNRVILPNFLGDTGHIFYPRVEGGRLEYDAVTHLFSVSGLAARDLKIDLYAAEDVIQTNLPEFSLQNDEPVLVSKSQLSATTNAIFYYALQQRVDNQWSDGQTMQFAFQLLAESMEYCLEVPNLDKLIAAGRDGLKLFHDPEGITCIQCAGANTNAFLAARAWGFTNLAYATGYMEPNNGDFNTNKFHAWVYFFDTTEKKLYRLDATPAMAPGVASPTLLSHDLLYEIERQTKLDEAAQKSLAQSLDRKESVSVGQIDTNELLYEDPDGEMKAYLTWRNAIDQIPDMPFEEQLEALTKLSYESTNFPVHMSAALGSRNILTDHFLFVEEANPKSSPFKAAHNIQSRRVDIYPINNDGTPKNQPVGFFRFSALDWLSDWYSLASYVSEAIDFKQLKSDLESDENVRLTRFEIPEKYLSVPFFEKKGGIDPSILETSDPYDLFRRPSELTQTESFDPRSPALLATSLLAAQQIIISIDSDLGIRTRKGLESLRITIDGVDYSFILVPDTDILSLSYLSSKLTITEDDLVDQPAMRVRLDNLTLKVPNETPELVEALKIAISMGEIYLFPQLGFAIQSSAFPFNKSLPFIDAEEGGRDQGLNFATPISALPFHQALPIIDDKEGSLYQMQFASPARDRVVFRKLKEDTSILAQREDFKPSVDVASAVFILLGGREPETRREIEIFKNAYFGLLRAPPDYVMSYSLAHLLADSRINLVHLTAMLNYYVQVGKKLYPRGIPAADPDLKRWQAETMQARQCYKIVDEMVRLPTPCVDYGNSPPPIKLQPRDLERTLIQIVEEGFEVLFTREFHPMPIYKRWFDQLMTSVTSPE